MNSVNVENETKRRSRSKMQTDSEEQEGCDNKLQEVTVVSGNNKNNEKGDGWNIALLLFLYLLQGIPLGLSAAIPIILQNRKVSYKDQVSILNFLIFI